MISIIVFYLIIFISSVLFYILYRGVVSFYLFLFIASLPVVSLVSLVASRKKVSFALSSPAEGRKNGQFPVIISISNKSLFPFPIIKITLSYYNHQIKESKKFQINTSASGKNDFQLKITLSSAYCGIIGVSIDKVRIYDFMGIFSCKIPKKQLQASSVKCRVLIFPEVLSLNTDISSAKTVDYESEFFSKTQKGDDPSEIFDMHDYMPGDKLNKVHWKLSAKLDNIFVKDYSLPESSSVYIFYNYRFNSNTDEQQIKNNDAILEMIFSLSYYLCENELSHKIIFFSKENGYRAIKIEETEDLYSAFFEMIDELPQNSDSVLATSYVYENPVYPMSRILFFSSDCNDLLSDVDDIFSGCRISVFTCKGENSPSAQAVTDNFIDVISIDPDNIQASAGYIDI